MKNEYNTKQRALILSFLKENSAHVSAQDILTHLKEQNIKVGTATVYRTLEKFVQEGIVKKFVIDERSGACYQLAGETCQGHFHLKCLNCGKLIHLSCDIMEKMERHFLEEHGFAVSSGKTVIYGLCADCSHIPPEQIRTCRCHGAEEER